MTAATISNWQLEVGSAASPQVLTSIEEVTSISGVGKSNEQIDVTNFDSPTGTKEFIAGLAEGSEITAEANYIPAATGQDLVMTAVDGGETRLCIVRYTGTSPNKTFSFSGVCLGYEIGPSPDSANSITFTIKITGAITRA